MLFNLIFKFRIEVYKNYVAISNFKLHLIPTPSALVLESYAGIKLNDAEFFILFGLILNRFYTYDLQLTQKETFDHNPYCEILFVANFD